MKRSLILISIASVLFTSFFSYTAHAQTKAGCYDDRGNRVADVNITTYPTSNGCPLGSDPVTPSGNAGTAVVNSLSYTPLEPIPGQTNKQPNFCELLNTLFKVLIYLGGTIAVLYLVLGGITYMVSEVVDKRSLARDRIKAALIGLLILLASYLILFTINPNLVNACNVLNGNTGGVVQSQSSVEAINAQNVAAAKAKCEANGGSKFCVVPNNGTCDTITPYKAAICETMAPGQICVTRTIWGGGGCR